MPVRFMLFITFLWTALQILFGFAALDDSALNINASGQVSASSINAIWQLRVLHMQEVFSTGFYVPVPDIGFFPSMYNLTMWNYPWFQNGSNWMFIRYLFLLPMSFVFILFMVTVVAPVIISAIATLTSTFIGPVVRFLTGGG